MGGTSARSMWAAKTVHKVSTRARVQVAERSVIEVRRVDKEV